ncbi:winged helix-turn-helix domain-containing protein [Oryzihumus sp.]
MVHEPRTLTDARELRAIAHPLRMNILEALMLEGPMTASELGKRLGESPANCSWHLRKLAEHGFVAEAEGGTGRQRPWRATHRGMRWDEDEGAAEALVAGRALTRVVLDREVDRFVRAQERRSQEPQEWRDASSSTQSMLWLTAEEHTEINDQVAELLLSKMDRLEDPSRRPEGARVCAFMAWGIPAYPPADTSEKGS